MDFMEQSIRNEIPGIVKEIISDKVLSEIIVETRIGEIAAVYYHTLGARHGA
jgi:molybdopterin-binding protein